MLSLLTYYCGFSSPVWTWLDNISRCSSDRYRGEWWQLSQWQSVTWASTSHEVFRAEWLFGTLVNQTCFSMNLTDPVFFPFLRKFLCTAQFSAIVLFLVILIVSACGLTVGSPADCECVTAGRLGRLLEGVWGLPSNCLLLFGVMIQAERHFYRPLSGRWGRLWRTLTSVWAHWLSDTECVCSPTPLGNWISCPVIPVTPAYPFLCISAVDDKVQWLGEWPDLKFLQLKSKIWIFFWQKWLYMFAFKMYIKSQVLLNFFYTWISDKPSAFQACFYGPIIIVIDLPASLFPSLLWAW